MSENEILSELDYFPDQGALRFKGVRYLLIRPETLVSMQKALEARVGHEVAGEILYAGGFIGGQLSGQKYKQTFGLDERSAVQLMCRMGGEIGWGHFQLVELNLETRRLVVEVEASPFAEAYGAEDSAKVCQLIRGVLGGLGDGIFGGTVEARETRCIAQGNELCRFEIQAIV